uniref:Ig-like domain-containing protein n=1 Tax=Anopheles melas TaxID=34690 RepID=A0A182TSB8_9DIPT
MERAITTPAHSSVTTDSHHYYGVEQEQTRPVPSGGVANIILLDDRVYITPVRRTRRGNRTADPTGAIFAGPNFDEQIIFLNGPDLPETVEPVARARMGKVARNAPDEPLALPLRPIGRDPADSEQLADGSVVAVVYADQHETVRLNCEVDADITTGVWLKDGQIVHAADKKSRTADVRFVRESFGALTIADVLLEDDGVWQCEAENARGFFFNGRPIKLIVLNPPKEPYLLIDSRRLDAGNMFIPVKENSELTLACVSEGGNPKPTLTWEVLLSPGIDRHAQKLSNDVLELQEIRKDKCDVDSNPPSTPLWQKDDGDPPVPQTGDGFLNFSSIRREHSGWYKCTSRHLNFQYSSIGYYLSVRSAASSPASSASGASFAPTNGAGHAAGGPPFPGSVPTGTNSFKAGGQMEVELGGSVTLQCPQGSLGCWSHLDSASARVKGPGAGRHTQTGQFSLKDVVYQDAGTYKCVGQSGAGRKKLELQPTASVAVKGKEQERERERKHKTGATFLQFLLYTTRSGAEWVNWFLIVHSKQFLLAVERVNKKKGTK